MGSPALCRPETSRTRAWCHSCIAHQGGSASGFRRTPLYWQHQAGPASVTACCRAVPTPFRRPPAVRKKNLALPAVVSEVWRKRLPPGATLVQVLDSKKTSCLYVPRADPCCACAHMTRHSSPIHFFAALTRMHMGHPKLDTNSPTKTGERVKAYPCRNEP